MAHQKEKSNFPQYCTHCGGELIRIPKPAEKLEVTHSYGSDVYSEPLGTRYSPLNGQRQFGLLVQCINKKWYNHCTSYVDESSLHTSDLPELLKSYK
jgi:hypothetical protein